MKEIKTAGVKARTIAADVVEGLLKQVPNDGFKLTPEMMGKTYTVTRVNMVKFGEDESFIITLEDNDSTINLSAAALKKSRVLKTDDTIDTTDFEGNKNIVKRSDAEELWRNSEYFHTNMESGKDFTIPEKIHFAYAVLAEDRETGKPVLNPFNYKGFRKVLKHYQEDDSFPTMDDFKEELANLSETRIPGLSKDILVPEKYSWVKTADVANYRHTLILKDVE